MKKLLILSLLICPPIFDQDPLDVRGILEATRVGVFLDQHSNRLQGIYSTVLNFHDSKGLEYVNLNAGYIKRLEDGKHSPLFQVGLRADNLLALARSSVWGQQHTSLSRLPKIEFGPFLAGTLKGNASLAVEFIYGIGLAVGF